VMYSGNHSPVHPLDTLLAAAERLRDDPTIASCFVGGGSEWRKIAEKQKTESRKQKSEGRSQESELRGLSTLNSQASTTAEGASSHFSFQLSAFSFSNILCLPYQPLDQLAGSLSAADLHIVVMGDAFVGLVHPCKVYNILSVAAPVLYIGPRPSHLSEILGAVGNEYPCASAAHGEVDRVVEQIQKVRRESGTIGRQVPTRVRSLFSKEVLLPRLIEELESG
jgi:colanic acid biosynthesis glycosyl transferase WcaI